MDLDNDNFRRRAYSGVTAVIIVLATSVAYVQPKSLVDQAYQEAAAACRFQSSQCYLEALRKEAEPHEDESARFLSGLCEPPYVSPDLGKEGTCELDKAKFQVNYWLALQGDHHAQKNVIFCFEKGGTDKPCSGTVRPNAILSCAWELVALLSGSPDVDPYDLIGYKQDCERKLLPSDRDWVQSEAFALFSRIYHRPLPSVQLSR